MGDFEYAPYEDYADPAGEWPGTRPLTAWPPADEFGRIDGSRQRGPAGWPPVTGYPPQDPRRDRGYQAPGSPRQAYQPGPWPGPARSGPMPVYRDGTGPMPTYPPDSGPIPRLHPESEPAAYARPRGGYRGTGGYPVSGGYKHSGTALLSGPSPISGPMPAHRSSRAPGTAGPLLPGGRRAPGWLPFSRRLVLLPKGLTFDGEEQLREHRDVNGGWLRPAVFGAMDGLVTNSSLIAGIGGGGGGHGAIVLTGIAVITVGMGMFTQLDQDTSYAYLLAALFVMGLGMGATMMPITSAALATLREHTIARGSTLMNIVQQVAASIGTAVFSMLLTNGTIDLDPSDPAGFATGLADAFAHVFVVATGMVALVLVPAFFLPRKRAKSAPPAAVVAAVH